MHGRDTEKGRELAILLYSKETLLTFIGLLAYERHIEYTKSCPLNVGAMIHAENVYMIV